MSVLCISRKHELLFSKVHLLLKLFFSFMHLFVGGGTFTCTQKPEEGQCQAAQRCRYCHLGLGPLEEPCRATNPAPATKPYYIYGTFVCLCVCTHVCTAVHTHAVVWREQRTALGNQFIPSAVVSPGGCTPFFKLEGDDLTLTYSDLCLCF